MDGLAAVLTGTGILIAAALGIFSIHSVWEREPRAARRSLLCATLLPLPFLATAWLDFPLRLYAAWALLGGTGAILLGIAIPWRPGRLDARHRATPTTRFDERDVVYVRRKLVPGTERFQEYYSRRPELLSVDNAFRAAPGLLSPDSLFYHRLLFAGVRGSLSGIYALLKELDGPGVGAPITADPEDLARFIKGWCKHLGAHATGITRLRDYHLYSVGGYKDQYSRPVEQDHPYAIALTVEMERNATRGGPAAPAWMEAAWQYENSANIAIQLAVLIRQLGYAARAHVFDNYQVVAPLVARDAGLGEIGRASLLMTPGLGPRVRIAVVTTDLPLATDPPADDPAVLEFCARCSKCADACPAQAISRGDPVEDNGGLRWKLDAEACYSFWCKSGAPCGRCMAVCPHAHPDAFPHTVARRMIRRSMLALRLMIWLDDVFYGRIPPSLPLEPWMDVDVHEERP